MEAVEVASDGDTIHIAPGRYLGSLVLDRDLNLIGTGGKSVTILDADDASRVARVTNGTSCEFSGLHLLGGLVAKRDGGVLMGDVASLILRNSTVSSCQIETYEVNSPTPRGGGIYNKNGTLTLVNTTMRSNWIGVDGGRGYGGAIFNKTGNVNITDSLFIYNSTWM